MRTASGGLRVAGANRVGGMFARQALVDASELPHDDVADLVGAARVVGGALRVV
jgi:hypothetical protein